MFHLILKDFKFTSKWSLAAALYGIIVSVVMQKEAGGNWIFTIFLVPFFVVSLPLGKILNMEDNSNTRGFIKRMPYSTIQIVTARVLFILIMLLFSFACVLMAHCFISDGSIGYGYVSQMIICFEGFFAYFMIYLSLYYRKSYYVAQNCIVICAMAAMLIAFLTQKLSVNINFYDMHAWKIILVLGIIDVALFRITYVCAKQNNFK